MKLAIITARGGSKRIPRKNIRNFCGKPIIAYSIQAAINSDCFDEVMVSTDDFEIAEISKQYGAKVPFMRSAQAASDHATTAEVLLEVLNEYEARGIRPELICGIYPTAPFITPKSLKNGMELLLNNNNFNSIFPIVRFSYPIQRALWLEENKVAMINPQHLLTRSQDLQPAYHDVGQFYWLRADAFKKHPSLIPPGATGGLPLPEWEIQDIDHEDDWILAEMKYRLLLQEKVTG